MVPCVLPKDVTHFPMPSQYKCEEKTEEVQWILQPHFCNGATDCCNEADESFCNLNHVSGGGGSPVNNKADSKAFHEVTADVDDPTMMSCFRFQSNNIWTPELARPCNGKPECFFMEDECDMGCNPLPLFCNLRTFSGSFNCLNNHILPGRKVCDGKMDCENGDDEKFCPRRFYCRTGNVINVEIEKICDYETDCDDESDEINCSKTHFHCENGQPAYVRRQQVMDGKADCSDGSDECPRELLGTSIFSSNGHMIKQSFLRSMVWIMGLFATVGNFCVFVHEISMLKSSRRKKFTNVALMYNILILNVALADFLMGYFLLYLGVQNQIWSGLYCFHDRGWRTGLECNILGVLSTLSAEVSLTSLAFLASYRYYCVFKPLQSRSFKIRTVVVCVACSWLVGFAIALTPLYKPLENYFLTHIWLKSSPYFTHDIIQKSSLQKFCRAHLIYDNLSNYGSHMNSCSEWGGLINSLVRTNVIDIVDGAFGYYSKHATCLPKMFLTLEEPSWEFSLGVTIYNFVLCIYIAVIYITICHHQVRGPISHSVQRSNVIQKRIAMLIVSDCACWIPVCLVAFLRFSGFSISDEVYAITAIVLLPINSAVNPFFHSSPLTSIRLILTNSMKVCRFGRNKKTNYSSKKRESMPQSNANLRVSIAIASRSTENTSLIRSAVLETRV